MTVRPPLDRMDPDPDKVYPRSGDTATCYLKNVVTRPTIIVGDYSIYHDFEDPTAFERKNVLYHYPINDDRLVIGKFCSIACGAKFLMNGGNHSLSSLTTYPFPILGEEWRRDWPVSDAWDHKGDIIVGNDVWIGYEAAVLAGVRIGDGAIVAARSVVTRDVPPYAIVGGSPAKVIRRRFSDEVTELLQASRWWDWSVDRIREAAPLLSSGDFEAFGELVRRGA